MLEPLLIGVTFAAAVASGVVGGMFYAFSTFIMGALGRMPAEQGAAAMRHINVTVINPAFMAAFMGAAVLSIGLAIAGAARLDAASGKLVVAAGLLYLGGCFGVTMFLNVPLNNRLAAGDVAEAAAFWPRYQKAWTLWNSVRTAASVGAMALYIAALMVW